MLTQILSDDSINVLYCLSTDVKPLNQPNGSWLYEIDTKKQHAFDAENNQWVDATQSSSQGNVTSVKLTADEYSQLVDKDQSTVYYVVSSDGTVTMYLGDTKISSGGNSMNAGFGILVGAGLMNGYIVGNAEYHNSDTAMDQLLNVMEGM